MLIFVLGFTVILLMVFASLAMILNILGKNPADFFNKYSLIVYATSLILLCSPLVINQDLQPQLSLFNSDHLATSLSVMLLSIPIGLLFFKFEIMVFSRLVGNKLRAHRTVVAFWGKAWFIPTLLTIVVIEEFIWRAWLPNALANEWTLPWVWCAVISSLAFGSHHVFFGWIHIILKSGYGLVWLLMTQISESLLPAILSHCAFNFAVYWKSTNQSSINLDHNKE